MKYTGFFSLVMTAAAVLWMMLSAVTVHAENISFTLEPYVLTEQRIEESGYMPLTEEQRGIGILCFSVSGTGQIAVGYGYTSPFVSIYGADGAFQSGFQLDTHGGVYDLEWQEDFLWVYIVRSDTAMRIMPGEGVQAICDIPDTVGNNSAWNQLSAQKQVINGSEYRLREHYTSFFTHKADTIVRIEPDGSETIVFSIQPEAEKYAKELVILAVIAFSMILTAFLIMRHSPKEQT